MGSNKIMYTHTVVTTMCLTHVLKHSCHGTWFSNIALTLEITHLLNCV